MEGRRLARVMAIQGWFPRAAGATNGAAGIASGANGPNVAPRGAVSSWLRALLALGLLGGPVLAQDFLPEPDVTYFGNVPAGSQVAIDHPAGLLDSVSAAGGAYVLVVRLVQPVAADAPGLPPAGSALVGDSVTLIIDGVAQGQVQLDERGAVYQLDIPNPVTVPAPNETLQPVRVVPEIGAATPTPTGVAVGTPTATGTASGSGTPTPSPTPTPEISECVGDCNTDGQVSINELILGVNIALGRALVDDCLSFDRDLDGSVAISELIAAVNNALQGCAREL